MDIFKKSQHLTQNELSEYALGKDNRKQRHCVEHHLNDCPMCSDAVDGFRMRTPKIESSAKTAPTILGMSRFSIAASAILLLGACLYFFFASDQAVSCDKLFSENFQIPAVTNHVRAAGVKSPELSERMTRAFDLLKNNELSESAKLFHQQLQEDPGNTQSLYYLGIISLQQGKTNDALEFLEGVREDVHCKEYKNAAWFLALCALKKGNINTASEWLKITEQEGGLYYADATKLLKNINKNG